MILSPHGIDQLSICFSYRSFASQWVLPIEIVFIPAQMEVLQLSLVMAFAMSSGLLSAEKESR